MSDAIDIAATATEVIEYILADMFAGNYPNNEYLLGTLTDEKGREIQVQLRVTREPSELMDE